MEKDSEDAAEKPRAVGAKILHSALEYKSRTAIYSISNQRQLLMFQIRSSYKTKLHCFFGFCTECLNITLVKPSSLKQYQYRLSQWRIVCKLSLTTSPLFSYCLQDLENLCPRLALDRLSTKFQQNCLLNTAIHRIALVSLLPSALLLRGRIV